MSTLTNERLKALIRQEIRNSDYETYIIQLLTGTGLESRVKSLVQDQASTLKSKVEDRVASQLRDFRDSIKDQVRAVAPKEARDEVKTYLSDHLESEINKLLLKLLPALLPAMVKAEMLERVQSMSGVELLLKEHSAKVNERLEAEYQYLQQQRLVQLAKIKELTDTSAADFAQQAQATANAVVSSLIGSNGSIIKGFSDQLATDNRNRFDQLQAKVDTALQNYLRISEQSSRENREIQLRQAKEITSLQSSLGWAWGLNICTILVFGVVLTIKLK